MLVSRQHLELTTQFPSQGKKLIVVSGDRTVTACVAVADDIHYTTMHAVYRMDIDIIIRYLESPPQAVVVRV